MCGCEVFIQSGTYQESLNHWLRRHINLQNRYLKTFISITHALSNYKNIASGYSNGVLPYVEHIHPCENILHSPVCVILLTKTSNLQNVFLMFVKMS